MEENFGLQFQKDESMARRHAAKGRLDGRSRKLRDHIISHKHESESRLKVRLGYEHSTCG